MKFRVEIDCDNAAFDDDPRQEIESILDNVGRNVLTLGLIDAVPLHDINGTRVGCIWLES